MLLFVVVCAILIAAVDFTSPYLTAKFVDEVLLSRNKDTFYKFIMLLSVIGILAIASNWFRAIVSAEIKMKVTQDLSEDIICHVQRLNCEFLLKTDMVYLSKRIDNDANDFISFVIDSIAEICIHLAMIFIAVCLLLSIKIKWLIFFLIIAVLHIVAYNALKKNLFELSISVREADSQYFSEFSDNFLYAFSIKLHSQYEEYISRFRDAFAKYFLAAIRAIKIDFWFKTSLLNANEIFKVLVFLLGGLDVLSDHMSIGSFIALNGYCMLAMQGVSYFMNFGQGWQNALAAYARIKEIQNMPFETNGTIHMAQIKSIEARNIAYSFGKYKIICGFTQIFQRGKIYCLIGRNGAGKSTLINIVCGLLCPSSGEILYNGINIREIDMISARRKLISAVEQKDLLKNDTLSGGERRKISISNALSKASDVLIMDEPDNNIDTDGIAVLIGNILAGKENRITIIVSHNKRIIATADEIVDLSKS